MPIATPDELGADSAPAVSRPPAPRRSWFDPATARGALLIAIVGGLIAWALIELPQHLSVHWH